MINKIINSIKGRGNLSCCGLTILEIIVSTVIFALIMAGLVNLFVAAKRLGVHTRSRIQATELGKSFLGPLQMEVRADEWSNNCLGSSNCVAPPAVRLGGIWYSGSYDITDVNDTTLRRVITTITWSED